LSRDAEGCKTDVTMAGWKLGDWGSLELVSRWKGEWW